MCRTKLILQKYKIKSRDDSTKNNEVEQRINLIEASKAVKLATDFTMKKDYANAERILRDTSESLRGLPTVQRGLNELARCCSDNLILNTSSQLTSYQQSLEVENDSIFTGPPSTGLGISPIKTPRKTLFVDTFFPPSDDEDDFTNQKQPVVEIQLKSQKSLHEVESSSSHTLQSEVDSTNESITED